MIRVEVHVTTGDFDAEITRQPNGLIGLRWNDHGPNEWHEEYEQLEFALARLALLQVAAAGQTTFVHDVEEFCDSWESFARQELS